jgi:phosphoserine aminotransferase
MCDMSSDIFSREIDVSKFDLVYAGAQKNIGPAGMTLVIVKNSLLDTVKHAVPSMLDYRVYRDNQSMYNTPPVFSIYTTMLNLQWLKSKGGVKFIAMENRAKAQLLYDEIDRNPLFYGSAARSDRSLMNVTFRMHDPSREADFLAYAEKNGMVGVKGYRTVGGFRASLYNALPYESVMALVACMKAYAEKEVPHSEFEPAY